MSNIIRNLDWSILTDALVSVIPALICITIHEFSHGLIAYKLGDPTAKNIGRLSLNPIKHIDMIGLVMMAVFKFGWAKPVPINMKNFNNPKSGMAISAAAGPLSNILLSIVFLFLYGLLYPFVPGWGEAGSVVIRMIGTTAYISIALAIFNIIPLPPLDGSKVLFSFVPSNVYYKLMRYERYGMIALILIFATGVLGNPLSIAAQFVFDKLFVFADLGYRLILKLI